MRGLGFVVLCALTLPACRERSPEIDRQALYDTSVEIGALIADSQYARADSLATTWLAKDYLRAVAGLEPISDRLYEGSDLTYADTVAAYVIARQAHARRLAGDTLGTVRAYGDLLPYRRLLPDSTAARVLRWMAWNAALIDPVEGLRLMDEAEDWARERGMVRETVEILRCKTELVQRMRSEDLMPRVDGVEPGGGRPGSLVFLLLTIAAVLAIAEYLTSRPRSAYPWGRPGWVGR